MHAHSDGATNDEDSYGTVIAHMMLTMIAASTIVAPLIAISRMGGGLSRAYGAGMLR